MRRLHIRNVLFSIRILMNDFLPIRGKKIFPVKMPWCFMNVGVVCIATFLQRFMIPMMNSDISTSRPNRFFAERAESSSTLAREDSLSFFIYGKPHFLLLLSGVLGAVTARYSAMIHVTPQNSEHQFRMRMGRILERGRPLASPISMGRVKR